MKIILDAVLYDQPLITENKATLKPLNAWFQIWKYFSTTLNIHGLKAFMLAHISHSGKLIKEIAFQGLQ